MNPMQLIKQFMGKNMNPQQILEQEMVKNLYQQNPMIGNLIGMANKGNSKGIENFARNMCRERGIDYDEEFAKFMKQIKG